MEDCKLNQDKALEPIVKMEDSVLLEESNPQTTTPVQIKSEIEENQSSVKNGTSTSENMEPIVTEDASTVVETELQQSAESPGDKETDLYSYIHLKDFTSEIYKIEINNLPNYFGYGQLRKLLNQTLKLKPRKIKAIGQRPKFVFATFQNEEDRVNALNILNGYIWKGKALTAKLANPAADPMAKKRKLGDSEDCKDPKKAKEDDIPVELRLKNAVTPLWNVPYEEQLKTKENDIHKFLMKLGRGIEKNNYSLMPLISKMKKENQIRCCPLIPIIPSPVTSGYRNKCEFTVGRHLHTKERTVGFRLSAYKEGSMSVAEPDDCMNISQAMLAAVKSFQNYVRESDKDVYNPENHGGYWRQLTVRTSNNDDVLLIVVMHPQELTQDELTEEKNKLKTYFEEGAGSSCGVTSVYFNPYSKKEANIEEPDLFHLMGKKFMNVTLFGLKFQVSPEAFFQINIPATEKLYEMIAQFANAKPSSLVLDICCGTGSIGLSLAKTGIRVIGIEMCSEAVENAKLNASNNGISDVEFRCGKAEDIILDTFVDAEKKEFTEIIAIVDPPRAGLHQKVVKAIRGNDKIQKLIYVSCHPEAAFNNFVDFCRKSSNNYRGDPFYPTKAAVVDLFPHTPHKELVLMFERSESIFTQHSLTKLY